MGRARREGARAELTNIVSEIIRRAKASRRIASLQVVIVNRFDFFSFIITVLIDKKDG